MFPSSVPRAFADELPALYNTLLSTLDWFELEDDLRPTGVCVIDEPCHIVLFAAKGDTVEIMNKEFDVDPETAERACRAILRALPCARRIHLEVLFPPSELKLPKRVLYWTDHMILDLPETVDEYTASLGSRTRREIRTKWRRLQQDHPDVSREMVLSADDPQRYVDLMIGWKNQRFNRRGDATIWQQKSAANTRFADLVRRRGQIRVTRIDGEIAALNFNFAVGSSLYVPQSGFDPKYEAYSLGFLNSHGNIEDAIRTGHRRVSLLWGQEDHKRRLGARPRRATKLSVFRRESDRLRFFDEGFEVAWRNLRRDGQREYWRARHALGRRARQLGLRGTSNGEVKPDNTSGHE